MEDARRKPKYNAAEYKIGSLCKRNHDYDGEGHSTLNQMGTLLGLLPFENSDFEHHRIGKGKTEAIQRTQSKARLNPRAETAKGGEAKV
jgi:hypothetical protein